MRRLLALLVVNVLVLTAAGSVTAEMVVVPGDYTSTEGRTQNDWPFNIGATTMRYQQVYASSEFAALTSPQLITSVRFRPDAETGDAFSATLPDIQINLSTTSRTPHGLSVSFADNIGADDKIVYGRGALALSSADIGDPAGPQAFDIVIDFSDPFLYDPTAGNLLLDVRNYGGGITTAFDAESQPSVTSRIYSTTGVTSLAGNTDSFGLVTMFVTQEVPEPGAFTLFAGMIGLGLSVRWWRRQR